MIKEIKNPAITLHIPADSVVDSLQKEIESCCEGDCNECNFDAICRLLTVERNTDV